jgi:hypothetical protein
MGEANTIGLVEAHRVAWIKTVLTVTGTEPQRRAFIAGFNGDGLPRRFSAEMHRKWELGRAVYGYLHPTPTKGASHDR